MPAPPFVVEYLGRFAQDGDDDPPIADIRFVALDSETTGLDPRKDRLVTIGAVMRAQLFRFWPSFRPGSVLTLKTIVTVAPFGTLPGAPAAFTQVTLFVAIVYEQVNPPGPLMIVFGAVIGSIAITPAGSVSSIVTVPGFTPPSTSLAPRFFSVSV